MAATGKTAFVAHAYRNFTVADFRATIQEVLAGQGVTPIYADKVIESRHILEKIRSLILDSDFGIYDVSNWNPNVTLELGMAMGHGRPWLMLLDTRKRKGVPADLAGFDRVEYNSLDDLRTKLVATLPTFISCLPATHAGANVEQGIDRSSADVITDVVNAKDKPMTRLRKAGILTNHDLANVLKHGREFVECLTKSRDIPPEASRMGRLRDDFLGYMAKASKCLGLLDSFLGAYAHRTKLVGGGSRFVKVDIFREAVRASPGLGVPSEMFDAISEMTLALALLSQDAAKAGLESPSE